MRMAFSVLLTAFMFAFLTLISSAASDSQGTGKVAPNQGLTLEKIGQGVKSAAKNIEEEIFGLRCQQTNEMIEYASTIFFPVFLSFGAFSSFSFFF